MTTVVLDTNVVFSGLAFDKNLEKLLVLLLDNPSQFKLYRSKETSQELVETLQTDKFRKYRGFSIEQINLFLEVYFAKVILTEVGSAMKKSRDKDGDKFLDLSVAVRADYLITGDKDLLILKSMGNTSILKPSEFLELGRF